MTNPSTEPKGPGPRGRALFLFYWLPFIVYVGLIFSGSSVQGDLIPTLFPYMDKIAHLLEYSLLGLLLGRAIRATFTGWGAAVLIFATVGLGGVVGLFDEIYQARVPGRQSDPFDWLTDLTAIAVAMLLAQVVHIGPFRGDGASSGKQSR